MTKKAHDTPLLDELKDGPWPSFVEGLERLASDEEQTRLRHDERPAGSA